MGRPKQIDKFLVIRTTDTGRLGPTNSHSGPYNSMKEAKEAQAKWFLGLTQDSQIVQVKATVSKYDNTAYLPTLLTRINDFITDPSVKSWRGVFKFAVLAGWGSRSRTLCQCPDFTKATSKNQWGWEETNCKDCSYNVRRNGLRSEFEAFFATFPDKRFQYTSLEADKNELPWSSCPINIIGRVLGPIPKNNMGPLTKLCLALSGVFQTKPSHYMPQEKTNE